MKNFKIKIKNEAHKEAIRKRLNQLRIDCFIYKEFIYDNRYANSIDIHKEITLDDLYDVKEFKGQILYYSKANNNIYNCNNSYDVSETDRNMLKIGCSIFDIREVEKLLKEYKEYLNEK